METPQLLPLLRILVIEAMQAKLQQLFECEGYGVEIANRAVEGQTLLRNAPPSVLVLGVFARGASQPSLGFPQLCNDSHGG